MMAITLFRDRKKEVLWELLKEVLDLAMALPFGS